MKVYLLLFLLLTMDASAADEELTPDQMADRGRCNSKQFFDNKELHQVCLNRFQEQLLREQKQFRENQKPKPKPEQK